MAWRAVRSSCAEALLSCAEVTMAKYLVIYQSTVPAASQMANVTPDQAKAGMDAWMRWAGNAAGAVVDLGSPLGNATRVESSGGTAPGNSQIAGFSVLQAESKDAVLATLKG